MAEENMQGWEGRKSMNNFHREPVDERYRRDPIFHTLVDALYIYILEGQFTPTELREACHLAACRYELEHIRPIMFDPKRPFEWSLKITHGVDCEKKPHVKDGYLHDEDDDTPYDVDGYKYCGRCHTAL